MPQVDDPRTLRVSESSNGRTLPSIGPKYSMCPSQQWSAVPVTRAHGARQCIVTRGARQCVVTRRKTAIRAAHVFVVRVHKERLLSGEIKLSDRKEHHGCEERDGPHHGHAAYRPMYDASYEWTISGPLCRKLERGGQIALQELCGHACARQQRLRRRRCFARHRDHEVLDVPAALLERVQVRLRETAEKALQASFDGRHVRGSGERSYPHQAVQV
eukprot:18942-Prymnesium_polylepis.1